MRVEDWLRAAIADAEQRGLPQLKPLLEAIAKSTVALRSASPSTSSGQAPSPSSGQARSSSSVRDAVDR